MAIQDQKKNRRIEFRLTESEMDFFLACFAKSNCRTHSQFFCKILHNTKVVQVPLFGINNVLNELIAFRRQIEGIATNVNQMARHLNESQKESILGYNVSKMLEILPKVQDLQKELDAKTASIQSSYIDYLNKSYQDED